MKNLLEDIIPLICYKDISSEDSFYKIVSYQELFPKDLWNDILCHNLVHNQKPTLNLLPSRDSLKMLESKTIKPEHTLLFASWIDRKRSPTMQFI